MPTNQELFDHGNYIDQWDHHSGLIEVLVEYQSRRYLIVTKSDNSEVLSPSDDARPFTPAG